MLKISASGTARLIERTATSTQSTLLVANNALSVFASRSVFVVGVEEAFEIGSSYTGPHGGESSPSNIPGVFVVFDAATLRIVSTWEDVEVKERRLVITENYIWCVSSNYEGDDMFVAREIRTGKIVVSVERWTLHYAPKSYPAGPDFNSLSSWSTVNNRPTFRGSSDPGQRTAARCRRLSYMGTDREDKDEDEDDSDEEVEGFWKNDLGCLDVCVIPLHNHGPDAVWLWNDLFQRAVFLAPPLAEPVSRRLEVFDAPINSRVYDMVATRDGHVLLELNGMAWRLCSANPPAILETSGVLCPPRPFFSMHPIYFAASFFTVSKKKKGKRGQAKADPPSAPRPILPTIHLAPGVVVLDLPSLVHMPDSDADPFAAANLYDQLQILPDPDTVAWRNVAAMERAAAEKTMSGRMRPFSNPRIARLVDSFLWGLRVVVLDMDGALRSFAMPADPKM